MRLSKTKQERLHAKKRAMQRFGIQFGKKHEHDIINQIRTNKATFIRRESLRVTVWRVLLNQIPAIAIYDSYRHVIVSLWPEKKANV